MPISAVKLLLNWIGAGVVGQLAVWGIQATAPPGPLRDWVLVLVWPLVIVAGTLVAVVWLRQDESADGVKSLTQGPEVSREQYERERDLHDVTTTDLHDVRQTLARIAEAAVTGGVAVEATPREAGQSEVRFVDASAKVVGEASFVADAQVVAPPPIVEGRGTVAAHLTEQQPLKEPTSDAKPSPRDEMLARIDRLLPEGAFLFDRIRAGEAQYRDHASAWLTDADALIAEYGAPTGADIDLDVLPLSRSDGYPQWAHDLAAEIDSRLMLLRGKANRRYGRVVVHPETAHLRGTTYSPTVIVSQETPSAQGNAVGPSGSVEAVAIPGKGSPTLDQVAYETQGRRHFAFESWQRRPKAIRFSVPEDRLIRPADLPAEIRSGNGRLVVEKFYADGVVIDEDDTVGDPVAFVGYFDD